MEAANKVKNPLLTVPAFLIAGLGLAIGWGMRGNFGHEYGAMMAGVIAVMGIVLISGREDWQRRMPYFALFGAMGWGFGATISYMQVVAYTHSGDVPASIFSVTGQTSHAFSSTMFGFFGLFYIGFLWAAMGGAGFALPAVMDREKLSKIFWPLTFVLGAWVLFYQCPLIFLRPLIPGEHHLPLIDTPVFEWLSELYQNVVWEKENSADGTWSRHESPFYWFDADWTQAVTALIALCIYDIVNRLKQNAAAERVNVIIILPVALVGALLGFIIQWIVSALGLADDIAAALSYPLGDASGINPETGVTWLEEEAVFMTNWPQFMTDSPNWIGVGVGLVVALAVYFILFGKFRNGASLFASMALGWLTMFLFLPVLVSNIPAFSKLGGIRMTPPRADDWAGITGVFIAMCIWAIWNKKTVIAVAAVVSGTIGGIGFSGMQLLKLMMIFPGNPKRGLPEETVDAWYHWQHSNWHSFLEQSYGFVNGIALLAVAILLSKWLSPMEDPPSPIREGDEGAGFQSARWPQPMYWTEGFSIFCVLVMLTYVNLYKNVREWVEAKDMPAVMKMPLTGWEWTAAEYFNLAYFAFGAGLVLLMYLHTKRRLDLIPRAWIGKGQMLLLAFVWIMVIGNFERALPRFTAGRLFTEGVIYFNAIVLSMLILYFPRKGTAVDAQPPASYEKTFLKALALLFAAWIIMIVGATGVYSVTYGNVDAGHAGKDGKPMYRFGEDSVWRSYPILFGEKHE